MEISYSSEDQRIRYKLVYITSNPYRYHPHAGKSWPKTTQCLLFKNGTLVEFGTVTKHANDEDNMPYAIVAATKKVMGNVYKEFRKEIWDKIFTEIDNSTLTSTLV